MLWSLPGGPSALVKRLFFVVCAVLFLGFAFVFSIGWLLTKPVQAHIGSPPSDLAAEAVSFKSKSGTVVHGWLSRSAESKGAVILLPGIRANRLSMVERGRLLYREGYSVLLVDLQGTGETQGKMITFGWRERLDVIAAVDFLKMTSPSKIALLGTSLGGAAALFASRDVLVDALILESVYPSLEQATKNRLHNYLGRIGTFGAPLLLGQLRPRMGVSPGQLRPIEHLQFVRCPVFIIGGASDRHTTEADTVALYAAARLPKALWIVPNVAHVDFQRAARDEYERRVLSFLEQAFLRRNAG